MNSSLPINLSFSEGKWNNSAATARYPLALHIFFARKENIKSHVTKMEH
jgi:hypothetical protein